MPRVNKELLSTSYDDVVRLSAFFHMRPPSEELFMQDTHPEKEKRKYRIGYEELLPHYWHCTKEYSCDAAFVSGSDAGSAFRTMLLKLKEEQRRASNSRAASTG